MGARLSLCAWIALAAFACGVGGGGLRDQASQDGADSDLVGHDSQAFVADEPADSAAGDPGGEATPVGDDSGPRTLVAVTFNTGIHPIVGVGGFTDAQSQHFDAYYSHGLAWGPAIAEAKAFFELVRPDVVVFQEIFDIERCAVIPPEARAGFVCESWAPGAPSVEELILGPGYQVACNWHLSDKCAAVRRQLGTFRGCAADVCRDGLVGSAIDGCSSGGQIGRGVIDLATGGTLTVVNVHGSSGVTSAAMACRAREVDQVFVDLGDGAPAANGWPNLVLGDFNTDPRNTAQGIIDPSAWRWNDFVGPGKPFSFVNEHVSSYLGVLCIDNVVSDALTGTCWYPGFSDGHPPVSTLGAFDHAPTVCTLTLP